MGTNLDKYVLYSHNEIHNIPNELLGAVNAVSLKKRPLRFFSQRIATLLINKGLWFHLFSEVSH